MKEKYILALLLVGAMTLTSCDYSLPGEVTLPAPTTESTAIVEPTATEIPVPTATLTPALWNYTQVSCEGKPLYAWQQPGTYTYSLDELFTATVLAERTEPVLISIAYDACAWFIVGFGGFSTLMPTSGSSVEWSQSCQEKNSSTLFTQNIVSTVAGWEEITTRMGTFQALRVDTTNTHTRGGIEGVITTSDWYLCGYGLIYSKDNNEWWDTYELLSYAPLTTDESRVRYILADIQLGGVDGYYRAHVDSEEAAEALRRWDVGITVTNIDQFERKLVGETWQVVYAGTETLINGMDVLLTIDPQP